MKIVFEMAKIHKGDVDLAKFSIANIARHGFWGVKFQAYDLKDLNKKHPNYKRNKDAHFTIEQLKELASYANALGLEFYCSAFSRSVIKPLAEFTNHIKVPSTFLGFDSFIRDCCEHFGNVHISSGMHNPKFVTKVLKNWIVDKILFVYHCVSEYPCFYPKLSRLDTLWTNCLSYHGSDLAAFVVAVVKNVNIMEVHYDQWANNLGDISKAVSGINSLMWDDGKPSGKELENFEFYRTEYKELSKNVKSRMSSK